MILRFAALSIAEMTARIPSKLGISEERTCFCIVRRRVTTLRLRSERFNVWRVRLAADLVLAIDYKKLWTWTFAVVIAICQELALSPKWRRLITLMRPDYFGRLPRPCSARAALYLSDAQ